MNIISRDGDLIVTRDEAKSNSRVTTTAEDSNFDLWIEIAHNYAETYANLIIQQATVEQVFDCQEIEINGPVRGIVSVKTYASDDTETTLTDYTWKRLNSYGLSVKLSSKTVNYAVIRYIGGFGAFNASSETAINEGTITAYPQLKQAILLLTNHFYENRGQISDFNKYELPIGVHALLDQVVKYR